MTLLARGHVPSPDPAHGKPPTDRTVEEHLKLGVVNLDKPAGPTSHQVTGWVRDALHVEKGGSGGTLDPAVTGVLPIALDDATRAVKTLLEAPKEYVAVFEAQGEVPEDAMRATLERFRGPIWQVPPVRSAVKRELRVRTIYEMDILEVEGRRALFRVRCESGTYIRKLCHDVGTLLLVGGHMGPLRRTRTGPFHESTTVTLHDVRDAYETWTETGDDAWLREVVRPVEELLGHLPRVNVRDGAVDAICHGARLAVPGVAEVDERVSEGDLVAMFTLKGEAIGVGRATMDGKRMVEDERGVAVATERVLMEPGTYPRAWKT